MHTLFLFLSLLSTNPHLTFAEANTAMQRGEFAQAAQSYEALIAQDIHDAEVYFNLGNAYLRLSQPGRAIGAYRHSESLLPRDQDVQKNLAFARAQTQDAVTPPAPNAVLSTLFFWHFAFSYRESLVFAVLCNLGFWSMLALWRKDLLAKVTRIGLPAFALLALLFVPSWAYKALVQQQAAVVQVPEVQVYASHSADAVVRFVLHDGAEAKLLERSDTWARIELADGKQGWVQLADIKLAPL